MSKIVVNRFSEGMVTDRYEETDGGFSVSKGFDILTLPRRLSPVRTTAADTASTGIGRFLVGSDGVLYGLGADISNPTTKLALYKKATASSAWAAIGGNTVANTTALNFDFFIEYPDSSPSDSRTFFSSGVTGAQGIQVYDKTGSSAINPHSLTYTSITQGIIHPKDDVLYIPYTTSTGTFIATFDGVNGWQDTVLTLPASLIVTSLAAYGNYLAIGCAPKGAYTLAATGKTLANSSNGGSFRSTVFLWDRSSTLNTVSESIDWGTGILQVLNVLNGVLIGISNTGGNSTNTVDRNSVIIKGYSGGQPQVIKEICTRKETTTTPSATINPFVNFIHRDRLYFSINIVGGSTSPAYYGLWSLGKSKESGRLVVTIERGATVDDSETGVLDAAPLGDYMAMVYSSNGTLGFSTTNAGFSTIYSATSYWESVVNPGIMATRNTRHDYTLQKQLLAVSVAFVALSSSAQVILKYKADGGSWKTIATYLASSASNDDTVCRFERVYSAAGDKFDEASQYEFRIESTGGAEIIELAYRYSVNKSNMVE